MRSARAAAVHAVCPFLKGWRHEANRVCRKCPAWENDEDYGKCVRMCFASADEIVRAVLRAIREPSEAILAEVSDADQIDPPDPTYHNARHIWEQMIDALLSEGE